MTEADILKATLTDRADIVRQVWDNGRQRAETVYRALPCALSRNSHTAVPRLRGELEGAAESGFAMMLYLPRGTRLLAGDRAEVLRENQRFRGICSASLGYSSHAVAMMQIQEVQEA